MATWLKSKVIEVDKKYFVIPDLSKNFTVWANPDKPTLPFPEKGKDPKRPIREYLTKAEQALDDAYNLLSKDQLSQEGANLKHLRMSWNKMKAEWVKQSLSIQRKFDMKVEFPNKGFGGFDYSHENNPESSLITTSDYIFESLIPAMTAFDSEIFAYFFQEKDSLYMDELPLYYGVEVKNGFAKVSNPALVMKVLKKIDGFDIVKKSPEALRKQVGRSLKQYEQMLKTSYFRDVPTLGSLIEEEHTDLN